MEPRKQRCYLLANVLWCQGKVPGCSCFAFRGVPHGSQEVFFWSQGSVTPPPDGCLDAQKRMFRSQDLNCLGANIALKRHKNGCFAAQDKGQCRMAAGGGGVTLPNTLVTRKKSLCDQDGIPIQTSWCQGKMQKTLIGAKMAPLEYRHDTV